MIELKADVQVVEKRGLYYVVKRDGRLMRFKPWLGDAFSFMYDGIMRNSIFPKKFGGEIEKHCEILMQLLAGVHGSRVFELATGSGSAVHFLPNDNAYIGTDVSPGLLRQAQKRFAQAGFVDAKFYVLGAEDLVFEDEAFDLCLCILALNFFSDADRALREIERVLAPEGVLVCSVPVPERNRLESNIRGILYSEIELAKRCQALGLDFQPLPAENGALLYFKAVKD